jgi:antibiotic biosynthesis monooxygenase (ABM) superfamily enzyme
MFQHDARVAGNVDGAIVSQTNDVQPSTDNSPVIIIDVTRPDIRTSSMSEQVVEVIARNGPHLDGIPSSSYINDMPRKVIEHRFGQQESLSLSTHNNNHNKKNGPLTVFARHRITAGKQDMFLAWIAEIDSVQRTKYKGYLGCEIIRPTPCRTTDDVADNSNKSQEYVSIFRYENYELLQQWMDSEDRFQMLEKTCDFEDEPIVTSYHSLEYWFVPPETEQQQAEQQKPPAMPSRPKMVFVTFLVIWFQVLFVTPYTIGFIPNLPPWAAQGLGTLLIVVLTTYLFMPIATKYVFRWWLFPTKQQQTIATNTSTTTTSTTTTTTTGYPEKDKPTLSTSTTTVTHRDSSFNFKSQDDDVNDGAVCGLIQGTPRSTNVEVPDEMA